MTMRNYLLRAHVARSGRSIATQNLEVDPDTAR